MILMKLLSPKSLPVMESDWKFHHKLYRILLRLFLFGYKRKVVFDHVILGESGAELLHSIKDEWFEQQLKRFHIEYIPPVKVVSISATHILRLGVFSWKDTMTLLYPQRVTSGKTESTKPKAKMDEQKAPIVVKVEKKEESKQEAKPETKPEAKPAPSQVEKRGKIRFKDDMIKPNPQKTTIEQKQEVSHDEYTHHQGFDENDIF